MAKIANAIINRISFDDELQCSSKVITASLQLVYGVPIDVVMVRDMLPAQYQKVFDDFWEKAQKMDFENLVGMEVYYERHFGDYSYGYDTIEWLL